MKTIENSKDFLWKWLNENDLVGAPFETGLDFEQIFDAMQAYADQQVSIAVEKALQVAADKAKINIWRNYPKVHDLDIINLTSHSEMGKDIIRVSKQSILSLAPKILEELKGVEGE